MAKLRLMRQQYLGQLQKNIPNNIEMYKNGELKNLLPDEGEATFEIDVEVNLTKLSELKPSSDHKDEVQNCLTVFNCLGDIALDLARDERLWAYLVHYHGLDYAGKRWGVNTAEEVKVSHIQSHYFAKTNRGVERDNAISRLWWIAKITSKATTGSLQENLTSLLFRSDVRANIIERPSTSRNINVLSSLLNELRVAYANHETTGELGIFHRDSFRKILVRLNETGGYKLLEALDGKSLRDLIIG